MNNEEKERRKAQGRNSKRTRLENMMNIYGEIAKEELTSKELQTRTGLPKSTLSENLDYLEKEMRAIEGHRINATETPDKEKIGRIIFRVTVDQIPNMIEEALSLLSILVEPFQSVEDSPRAKKLDKEFTYYRNKITELLTNYIIQLKNNREKALRLEIENMKKERAIDRSTKKPLINKTEEWKRES
jgi:hypothetical protein